MDFKLDQYSSVPLLAQIEAYPRSLISKDYRSDKQYLPKAVCLDNKSGVLGSTVCLAEDTWRQGRLSAFQAIHKRASIPDLKAEGPILKRDRFFCEPRERAVASNMVCPTTYDIEIKRES